MANARPAQSDFTWATNSTDPEGSLTKLTPEPQFQLTGTSKEQPIPRQWWNFIVNYLTEWVAFVADPYTLGYVFYHTQNLTTDSDFDPWGGVASEWSKAGPNADATGVTVYSYTKNV